MSLSPLEVDVPHLMDMTCRVTPTIGGCRFATGVSHYEGLYPLGKRGRNLGALLGNAPGPPLPRGVVSGRGWKS